MDRVDKILVLLIILAIFLAFVMFQVRDGELFFLAFIMIGELAACNMIADAKSQVIASHGVNSWLQGIAMGIVTPFVAVYLFSLPLNVYKREGDYNGRL